MSPPHAWAFELPAYHHPPQPRPLPPLPAPRPMDRAEIDLSVLDTGTAGYFDFLNEEEFRGLEGAASGGGDATDGGAHSGGVKRDRDTDDCQSEEGPEVSGSGTGKVTRAGGDGKGCKSKACREKARRERINER